jgi:hypothetical protein
MTPAERTLLADIGQFFADHVAGDGIRTHFQARRNALTPDADTYAAARIIYALRNPRVSQWKVEQHTRKTERNFDHLVMAYQSMTERLDADSANQPRRAKRRR